MGSIVGSRVRRVQSTWCSLTLSALGAPPESLALSCPATGNSGLTFGTGHSVACRALNTKHPKMLPGKLLHGLLPEQNLTLD